MACCPMVPSHYLNEFRLIIISEALWHTSVGIFTENAQVISLIRVQKLSILDYSPSPSGQWVNSVSIYWRHCFYSVHPRTKKKLINRNLWSMIYFPVIVLHGSVVWFLMTGGCERVTVSIITNSGLMRWNDHSAQFHFIWEAFIVKNYVCKSAFTDLRSLSELTVPRNNSSVQYLHSQVTSNKVISNTW